MGTPILTLVYDRKKRATKTKPASVELRITFERKARYIATGVRLLPREWWQGQVVRRIDAEEISETLALFVKNARRALNDMCADAMFNVQELKRRMDAMICLDKSFIEYMEDRSEIRKYGKKKDTKERYQRFIKFMANWGRIIYYADITDSNILALDRELKKRGLKDYSKWNNYHRFLNSFINDAVDEGLIKRNPYRWLHIEKGKTEGLHKYLTSEELKRIERAEMGTPTLERVRDLFVFQCYTCLSYVDLKSFDMKCAEEADGHLVYTARRGKTGQEFSFVLLRPARVILEKYDGHLPLISNVKYNEFLKVVAQTAGIDKPITSHWARHTGATMLLNEGRLDMEVIAKILGHASSRQTRETYAALRRKTLVSEMAKLDDIIL